MSNKELESLRQQADALNLEILKLINERGAVVKEIGKAKEAQVSTDLTLSESVQCLTA